MRVQIPAESQNSVGCSGTRVTNGSEPPVRWGSKPWSLEEQYRLFTSKLSLDSIKKQTSQRPCTIFLNQHILGESLNSFSIFCKNDKFTVCYPRLSALKSIQYEPITSYK